MRRPQVLDPRDPRREDQPTCTAVAPDVVFTVRMYGTMPLYGPRLVHNSSFSQPRTRSSATRHANRGQVVAQLRSYGNCGPCAARPSRSTDLPARPQHGHCEILHALKDPGVTH